MTLLKAYLVNTDNPFLMLKYYLESIDKIEKANIKQMKNIFNNFNISDKVASILYDEVKQKKDGTKKIIYRGKISDLTSEQTKTLDELSSQLKQFFKNNPELEDTSLGGTELFERVKSKSKISFRKKGETDFKNELKSIKFTSKKLINL